MHAVHVIMTKGDKVNYEFKLYDPRGILEFAKLRPCYGQRTNYLRNENIKPSHKASVNSL